MQGTDLIMRENVSVFMYLCRKPYHPHPRIHSLGIFATTLLTLNATVTTYSNGHCVIFTNSSTVDYSSHTDRAASLPELS